jgi:hypothetical protein
LRTIRPDVSFNQLSFAFDSVTGFIKITAVTGSNKYTGASIVGISSNQYTSSKTLLTSIFPYTMSISSSSLSNLQYTGTINLPNIIAEIQNDFPAVLTNQINFEIINDRFVKATAKSDSVNYIGESYIGINTST